MEKKSVKFKTSINCNGCVSSVKPHLDKVEGIVDWNVDINHKDKVLTVEIENITPEAVMDMVKKAGYKIEPI